MKRLLPVLIAAVLLGTATPAKAERTWLPCNPDAFTVSIRYKPRNCTILPPQASFAEGANLGKVRWKHWGKRRAYYRGISKGFHLPFGRVRVWGFAFRARPDACGARKQLFTRLLVKSSRGKRVVKTQTCVGFD